MIGVIHLYNSNQSIVPGLVELVQQELYKIINFSQIKPINLYLLAKAFYYGMKNDQSVKEVFALL